MSCLLIIGGFIFSKRSRKTPGDVILAIGISDFILSIFWITFGFYYTVNDTPPLSDGAFCQSMGYLVMFGATGQFMYNCVYITLLIIQVKQVLTIDRNLLLKIHLFSIIIMISVPTLLISINQITLNPFEVCSVKLTKYFKIFGGILVLTFIGLSAYSIIYFKRRVNNIAGLGSVKGQLLTRYIVYIVLTIINWILLFIANYFVNQDDNSIYDQGFMKFVVSTGNLSQIIGPVMLSLIRYSDSNISKSIFGFFYRIFKRQNSRITVQDDQLLDKTNIDLSLVEDSQEGLFGNTLQKIAEQLKRAQLETILFNLQIFFKKDIGDIDADELVYKLYGFPSNEILDNQKLGVLMPYYTKKLMFYDGLKVDINSFDIRKNHEEIQQLTGTTGGKSGQFFFFTHDKKWVIKTITQEESITLNSLMPQLCEYIENRNPQSRIAKLYGIFSFDFGDNMKPVQLVVMSNIFPVPKKYIERTFDLKGSDYDREVLKYHSNIDPSKLTLKDIDFIKREKKVHINEQRKNQIQQSLIMDSQFLLNQGLIDYSLLLIKVNWGRFISENEDDSTIQISKDLDLNKSEDEENIYYNFYIIDYLQEYTVKKQAEEKIKKLIIMKQGYTSSVQAPDIYCERFQQKVIYSIFV